MPLPTILFGVLLAGAYGAAFHLWRGGGPGKLLLFLLLAQAGFWLGDYAGYTLNWTFASVGVLNAGMGSLGAALFLLVGNFLSAIQVRPR